MPDCSDFPRFGPDEIASRHNAVQAFMGRVGVEALLFYGTGRFSDIFWLTDWPGSREAYVLFQQGEAPVVLVQLFNSVPSARVLSVLRDVRWGGPRTARTVIDLLRERRLTRSRVGLVGSIPYQQYEMMRAELPEAHFHNAASDFRMLRTIKSHAEIERIRFASRLTDEALHAMAQGLRPGIREKEIPDLLETVYKKAGGYTGIHHMTSMPMHAPDFHVPSQFQSNRELRRGDCLITEISGAYWGYSGQIHRTFSLGEGPTQEWRDLHSVAVEAFDAIAQVIKDGTSTREVEEAGDIIHRRGYTICDDLLHGANQHPPIIQTRTARRHENHEIIFRENMVVVVQPNVITPDERMGLQFGETLIVQKNGCESLNSYPREWTVCS